MKISKDLYTKFDTLGRSILDEKGRELMDPRPYNLDVSPRGATMEEQIQRLIRSELSWQAGAQGNESFDEADDFDDPEYDDAPASNYQMMEDEEPSVRPRAEVKGELERTTDKNKTKTKVNPPDPAISPDPDPDRLSRDEVSKLREALRIPDKGK